jgi:formate-dependent nitrite reductase membrane component NrfD
MSDISEPQPERSGMSFSILVVVVFNVLLITLNWFTWFGGDAQQAGAADRIFGQLRLGGFRADSVWLVVSTVGLGFAFLFFVTEAKRSREAKINAILCLVGVVAFCFYVVHALTSGVLDFG